MDAIADKERLFRRLPRRLVQRFVMLVMQRLGAASGTGYPSYGYDGWGGVGGNFGGGWSAFGGVGSNLFGGSDYGGQYYGDRYGGGQYGAALGCTSFSIPRFCGR